MRPSVRLRALAETSPWEYVVRFVFGGAVTVCTGLIAKAYGPSVGGLFLAFPAILPASLTLLKEHDGRYRAAQAAAGARLGAAGLIVYAAVAMRLLPDHSAAWTLAVATAAWALSAFILWLAVYGRTARWHVGSGNKAPAGGHRRAAAAGKRSSKAPS